MKQEIIDERQHAINIICKRLKTIRKGMGLTQKDWYEGIGISRSLCEQIESFTTMPSADTIRKISFFTGWTPAALLATYTEEGLAVLCYELKKDVAYNMFRKIVRNIDKMLDSDDEKVQLMGSNEYKHYIEPLIRHREERKEKESRFDKMRNMITGGSKAEEPVAVSEVSDNVLE